MGRELRRKQAKKEGKSLKVVNNNDTTSMKKLIKTIILVVFIVALIYLLSSLFVTHELSLPGSSDDSTEQTPVSNTILASEIFKQSEEEYYVYFYDYQDEDSTISSAVSSKLSSATVYKVDAGSSLNVNYISSESNKNAKVLSDVKVKAPTVIKISGEEIISYYEGDEIVNNLK